MVVFHTEIQRLVPLWAIRAFVIEAGKLTVNTRVEKMTAGIGHKSVQYVIQVTDLYDKVIRLLNGVIDSFLVSLAL
jgi:hypothetical protein